jgi:cytochrome b
MAHAKLINTMNTKILVWDCIVRVGHWLLAGSFIVAYLSAESERWRILHVVSGCLVFAAVVMRVLWGIIGSRHARFTNFVSAPKHAIAYLKSLASRHPEPHTGHNPAGGWAVMGLLNMGGTKLGEWHELAANLALLLVIIHVAAVLISSYLHKENLPAAMFTGLRKGSLGDRIKEVSLVGALLYFSVLISITYLTYHYAQ